MYRNSLNIIPSSSVIVSNVNILLGLSFAFSGGLTGQPDFPLAGNKFKKDEHVLLKRTLFVNYSDYVVPIVVHNLEIMNYVPGLFQNLIIILSLHWHLCADFRHLKRIFAETCKSKLCYYFF